MHALTTSNNFSNFDELDAAFYYNPNKNRSYFFHIAGFFNDYFKPNIPNNFTLSDQPRGVKVTGKVTKITKITGNFGNFFVKPLIILVILVW